MNDKLILENYLLVLKSTTEVFVHGTLESANDDVRLMMRECLNDILISQADTFDLMHDFDYYKVNNIKSSSISSTINKINES